VKELLSELYRRSSKLLQIILQNLTTNPLTKLIPLAITVSPKYFSLVFFFELTDFKYWIKITIVYKNEIEEDINKKVSNYCIIFLYL
jgi:hypothetical protein